MSKLNDLLYGNYVPTESELEQAGYTVRKPRKPAGRTSGSSSAVIKRLDRIEKLLRELVNK